MKTLLGIVAVLALWAGTAFGQVQVHPNCQFDWTVNDVQGVTGYVVKHGTVPGGPYPDVVNYTATDTSALCSEIPNAMAVGTHYVVFDVNDAGGVAARSAELQYEVVVSGSELCLNGTLNGSPVQLCVPITIQ